MTEIVERIQKLKKDRDAVILAHYYVPDEIQKIADYVGDSYYLSKIAAQCPQKVIVFCGVRFMGESAKILSPHKKVVMPDASADCPMAHMIDKTAIEKMRKKYPELLVVCYINSTAEIKALSDVCVTSSNAEKIVNALPQKDIYFVPDQHLGHYISTKLKDRNIMCNPGYCPIHNKITRELIEEAKKKHPQALVLMHPECPKEAIVLADYVGSTSGIIDYATKSDEKDFIIATEIGVLYKLKKANPHKNFYTLDAGICEDMKKITLKKVLHVLETLDNEIELTEDLRKKAEKALMKMHEIAQ
ncbi:MAG: quinolinate synthase NadA [Bacillota bacterium]|jgi:quinolinate synthase